jgi:integrase
MPKYKFDRRAIGRTTVEEVYSIIARDKSEGNWVGALTAFLYVFGCRISEALKLKPSDVELDPAGYLTVTFPILKQRRRAVPYGTTHRLRVVRSAPFVEEVIIPYVMQRKLEEPEGRLFKYSRVYHWKKLKALNGLLSAHIFRHDRLNRLAEKGASAAVLQDWAGWSDMRPASFYIRGAGQLAAQFSDKID